MQKIVRCQGKMIQQKNKGLVIEMYLLIYKLYITSFQLHSFLSIICFEYEMSTYRTIPYSLRRTVIRNYFSTSQMYLYLFFMEERIKVILLLL